MNIKDLDKAWKELEEDEVLHEVLYNEITKDFRVMDKRVKQLNDMQCNLEETRKKLIELEDKLDAT